MARWQPDARKRLQVAAMELFGERGYDDTTVAEIAERAGLTKRTFFRHFPDKREVLFSGGGELEALVVEGVAAAPAGADPLEVLVGALQGAATTLFEPRRDVVAGRQRIIDAHPDLQERELIKLARLAGAVAQALRERGVGDPAAVLAADAALAVFRVAFERWLQADDEQPLAALIGVSMEELRAVAR